MLFFDFTIHLKSCGSFVLQFLVSSFLHTYTSSLTFRNTVPLQRIVVDWRWHWASIPGHWFLAAGCWELVLVTNHLGNVNNATDDRTRHQCDHHRKKIPKSGDWMKDNRIHHRSRSISTQVNSRLTSPFRWETKVSFDRPNISALQTRFHH